MEINLYDVLTGIIGRGQREGRCFKFCSPFREERNPSFAVYPQTNTWYDFGLGEGGDSVAFFRKLHHCSYREALCEIEAVALSQSGTGEITNSLASPSVPAVITAKISPRIKNKTSSVITYLHSLNLPYSPEWGAFLLSFKKGWYIAFPCPGKKNPEGLECRKINGDGPEKMSLSKKTFWFYKRNPDVVLVTESLRDCLAAHWLVEGDFSLLAMNGLSNKNKTLEFITAIRPTVYLALDNDDDHNGHAGQKTQEEMRSYLKTENIEVRDLSWPYKQEGVKDFFRLLQKENQKI